MYSPDWRGIIFSNVFLDVFGQSILIVLLSSLSAYAGSPVLNIPRAVLISANKVEVNRTVLSPIIGIFIFIRRCERKKKKKQTSKQKMVIKIESKALFLFYL